MGRKISISEEDMAWLRKNHEHLSYGTMAKRLGCCKDTLKRILVREGLQEFDGAKYTPVPKVNTWNRPCMRCGCTKSRPKNLYYCDPCRANLE